MAVQTPGVAADLTGDDAKKGFHWNAKCRSLAMVGHSLSRRDHGNRQWDTDLIHHSGPPENHSS